MWSAVHASLGQHPLYTPSNMLYVWIPLGKQHMLVWVFTVAAPRRMAEETIDAAVASGRLPLNTRACTTRTLPLLGAQTYRPTLFAEVRVGQLCLRAYVPGRAHYCINAPPSLRDHTSCDNAQLAGWRCHEELLMQYLSQCSAAPLTHSWPSTTAPVGQVAAGRAGWWWTQMWPTTWPSHMETRQREYCRWEGRVLLTAACWLSAPPLSPFPLQGDMSQPAI
jgi:hypothetical protein